MASLHNLKKVRISGLKEVEINTPSLQSFSYNIGEGDTFVLNIDSSCDLKVLHLEGLSIRDQLFKNLMSKFPLLEDIHLQYVSDLKRIDISSQSLKKIDLDNCNQMVEAKIDTPNLFSFEYVGNGIPSLYCFRAPHQLKATIICLKYDINPSWLLALRKFAADWNPSRVLTLQVKHGWPEMKICDADELEETYITKVPEIEHLNLKILWGRCCCESLLNGLFWSCHPKNLSLKEVAEHPDTDLLKKFCELLLERKEDP
ncbi:unnamed protein product [Camellia sinensis]